MVAAIAGKFLPQVDAMKNPFDLYHPATVLCYFLFVIPLSIVLFHPVFAFVSFFCAAVASLVTAGWKKTGGAMKLCLVLSIVIILFNTAFNANGATVWFSFLGRQILLEGFIYGLCSALVLSSVVLWFTGYTAAIDSDRFLYLFGGIFPNAALLVSMTFSQTQIIRTKAAQIDDAQRGLYAQAAKGLKKRIVLAGRKISALLDWALEDSIETADSMHSRGYATGKRTKMRFYFFSRRDIAFAVPAFALFILVLVLITQGYADFNFYPFADTIGFDYPHTAAYAAYVLLMLFPLFAAVRESVTWHLLRSKT